MTARIYHVLFLCTGNSARSILAEAILNRFGAGHFRAYSAGSQPKGEVHSMALELLRERGYDTSGLRSKSWDEFAKLGAPSLDFVITVCDNAAGEPCPVWHGQPTTAHWSIEDPAALEGPDDPQRWLFRRIYRELARRIERLTQLRIEPLDRSSLQRCLNRIGKTEMAIGEDG